MSLPLPEPTFTDEDDDEEEELRVHLRCRGRAEGNGNPTQMVAVLTLNEDGFGRVRVDCRNNPAFWLELDLPPETILLLTQRVIQDTQQEAQESFKKAKANFEIVARPKP